MTKKFTEEQYQRIVNIWRSSNEYDDSIRLVLDYIDTLEWCGYEEAIAVANPLTREWAHDKFVEKEKKYFWKLKGLFLVRDMMDNTLLFDRQSEATMLSESEIREWGFNPEMFDREEV